MNKLKYAILPLAMTLSACGGGTTTEINASAMRVFSDGSGVAQFTTNEGQKGFLIAPDIAETITEVNAGAGSNSITDISADSFPITQTLADGTTVRSGAVTVDGLAVNVDGIEDPSGATMILMEVPNWFNMVMTGGEAYGGPLAGEYNYSGTVGMARRAVGTTIEIGTFDLGVNFTNSSVDYNHRTASTSFSSGQDGVLNASSGSFMITNVTGTTSGTSRTATIHGQLHGASANGVSGVLYTGESDPAYAGAFVGGRD